MRHRHGRTLRRRYGRAGVARPFEVAYDWAGVPYGRGSSPFAQFVDANRAAMEVVRSGKSKRAAVLYTEPRRAGDSSAHKAQKLVEYVLSPRGGVLMVKEIT